MHIRKRSFFEILLPVTTMFFVSMGTSFINTMNGVDLRWACLFCLFLYLFFKRKFLIYLNWWHIFLLLTYLIWCISTTLWSEVPLLSFIKSTVFAIDIIIFISAGGFWVIKMNPRDYFNWLSLILLVGLVSGLLGSSVDQTESLNLYQGMTSNANTFGYFFAIAAPFIFWNLCKIKKTKLIVIFWVIILILDIHFLMATYARSCIVIFVCVLSFFIMSFPVSKKILIASGIFFFIAIITVMIPGNYLEAEIAQHINKGELGSNQLSLNRILSSRDKIWQKSYQHALKGGVFGGGFAVTIGDTHFFTSEISGAGYGREKGNSQFAIMEETGIIGLLFYFALLICFFSYTLPYYFRFKGEKKIIMGLILGSMTGLLLESISEAWWDSAAGPEVICFWTFAGMAYGMVYLEKRRIRLGDSS